MGTALLEELCTPADASGQSCHSRHPGPNPLKRRFNGFQLAQMYFERVASGLGGLPAAAGAGGGAGSC